MDGEGVMEEMYMEEGEWRTMHEEMEEWEVDGRQGM